MTTLGKKLVRQSGGYLLGNIALRMAGFLSLPILTRLLTLEQYGYLNLVWITLSILVMIALGGLRPAAVRFYNDFKESKRFENLTTFYATLFWGYGGMSLLVALLSLLLLFWGGEYIFGSLAGDFLIWLLPIMIMLTALPSCMMAFCQAAQKVLQYNLIIIIDSYAKLIIGLVILLLISRTVAGFLIGHVIAGIFIFLFLTKFLLSEARVPIAAINIKFFVESLRFGIPVQIGEIANRLIRFSDRYIIQLFLGASAVGLYTVGAGISYYLKEIIFLPFNNTIFPIAMEQLNKLGKVPTERFVSNATKYVWITSIPIIVASWVLREDVVIFLASEKYREAAEVIPYLMAGAAIGGIARICGLGLHIAKQTNKLALLSGFSLIINIALNVILIPIYSLKGAAISTLISYAILMALTIKVSFPFFRIHFFPGIILKALFSAAIMGVMIIPIELELIFWRIIFKVVGGAAVYFLMIFILDKDLRIKSISLFQRFIVRKYTT